MQAASDPQIARSKVPAWFWLAACGLLSLLYVIVFSATRDGNPAAAIIPGIANGCSLALLGCAVFRLTGYAPSMPFWAAVWHGLFVTGFVMAWMTAITLMDAALNWAVSLVWRPWWFSGPGLTWQVLQGVFIYALIAITSAHIRLLTLHNVTVPTPDCGPVPSPAMKLVLVQQDAGLVPVDPLAILAVEATGDYVRLVRSRDSLLVKMTLTEAAQRLSLAGFIRVHRSWLVRLDAVTLFENIGRGRWRALLTGGQDVPVSRSGARLLRDLVL